jgi:F-type H+-transporting ATPase subunit gamma
MSGQLRTLKNRIRSVENTKKITRAMEMVAAAKLRRFQDMMLKARPFTEGLESLLRRLSQTNVQKKHPFIEAREEKRTAVVVITSDTGLCGSYNTELVERSRKFLTQKKDSHVIVVGKSGITNLKRLGYTSKLGLTDLRASRVEEVLVELKNYIEKLYLSGEVDAVYVVYSHFKTVTTYVPTIEKILPLDQPASETKEKSSNLEYIFEPSPEVIFERLIPLFFEAKVRTVFLESIVSEQIARMSAMHQATKNAKEMIDSLVLQRNKARQAAITKEIIEIVSGSRAQKMK